MRKVRSQCTWYEEGCSLAVFPSYGVSPCQETIQCRPHVRPALPISADLHLQRVRLLPRQHSLPAWSATAVRSAHQACPPALATRDTICSAAYTREGPCAVAHLGSSLPSSWAARSRARPGSLSFSWQAVSRRCTSGGVALQAGTPVDFQQAGGTAGLDAAEVGSMQSATREGRQAQLAAASWVLRCPGLIGQCLRTQDQLSERKHRCKAHPFGWEAVTLESTRARSKGMSTSCASQSSSTHCVSHPDCSASLRWASAGSVCTPQRRLQGASDL